MFGIVGYIVTGCWLLCALIVIEAAKRAPTRDDWD